MIAVSPDIVFDQGDVYMTGQHVVGLSGNAFKGENEKGIWLNGVLPGLYEVLLILDKKYDIKKLVIQ